VTGLRVNYCNFTLQEGLNLISFFCIPNTVNRDDVIINITNLISIFEYREGETDSWKSYNPNLPEFVIQDLTSMSRMEGYWINMEAEENFLLEGGLRIPTNINLVQGWNLAGYPKNSSEPVNTSFETIAGNFTEVRTYNATLDIFINYVPGTGGALTHTATPMGYWINATNSEVWIVD
jgi:hypothetical protein